MMMRRNSVENEKRRRHKRGILLVCERLHMYVMFRPQTKLYQKQKQKEKRKMSLNTNPTFQKTLQETWKIRAKLTTTTTTQ
jgi:hypothetical protein